jgi:hypothetical protein
MGAMARRTIIAHNRPIEIAYRLVRLMVPGLRE